MPTPETMGSATGETKTGGLGIPALVGGGVILFVVVVLFLVVGGTRQEPPVPEAPLLMGAVEQAYARKIRFSNLQMSQAANFLDQEFTYLDCLVENRGDRTIRQAKVVVEFRGVDGRVVLGDERPLFPPYAGPLLSGQEREIQFSWEKLPPDWNRQYPSIRVVGLRLD